MSSNLSSRAKPRTSFSWQYGAVRLSPLKHIGWYFGLECAHVPRVLRLAQTRSTRKGAYPPTRAKTKKIPEPPPCELPQRLDAAHGLRFRMGFIGQAAIFWLSKLGLRTNKTEVAKALTRLM